MRIACAGIVMLYSLGAQSASSGRLTFCFNDWPPYARMSDNGAMGISIEIIERAAALVGQEVQFVEREWNECLEKVAQGEFDAILDAAKRDAYLQGPASFNLYSDTFWVANDRDINRYEQLQAGEVALVQGYNYDARLLQHIDDLGMTVVRGRDDPTNIRDLAAGRYDAVVADLASTFAYSRENDLAVHPILPPFSFDRLYLTFNRDRNDAHREFDRAIVTLLETGVVDEIYQRMIGIPYSSFVTE